jgi:hypothetical protein
MTVISKTTRTWRAGNPARSRLLGGQSRLKAVPRGDPRPRLAALHRELNAA